MAGERPIYMGPRLRQLRRGLGLTQAQVAADLAISPSYVALLERNQRPFTAGLLLRLARTYQIEIAELAEDGGAEDTRRLNAVFRDPLFAGIDLPQLQNADLAVNYPGVTEALLRLHTLYREEQLALADQASLGAAQGAQADPVGEARRFLAARRNSFPALDDAAEQLAAALDGSGAMIARLKARHDLAVRRVPAEAMAGSIRRLDRHRREILLSEELDAPGRAFQLASQLVYLELREMLDAQLAGGGFATDNGRRLGRRALGDYAAAAILMPYTAFARAAEARGYDVEALARRFRVSFEQAAHRLTTLQKRGQERVPFFFLRVDAAGNVSKRLDGAGFPFARHGGGCPLWSIHHVFRTPGEVVTQWLELPDGQRFFSIARTVAAGGGAYGSSRIVRAVALACGAEHARHLAYTRGQPPEAIAPTPIGISCTLCQRTACRARAAPPVGRAIIGDDVRRVTAPFGFVDG